MAKIGAGIEKVNRDFGRHIEQAHKGIGDDMRRETIRLAKGKNHVREAERM